MEVVKLSKPKSLSLLMSMAAMGLVVSAAVQVSDLIWKFAAPAADALQPGARQLLDQRHESPTVIDLALVKEVFLLNRAGPAALTGKTVSPELETRLELTLSGILLNSNAAYSRAIIGTGNGQQVYRPGEALQGTPGTVTVEAVYAQHVVLNNNGRQELLRMDDTSVPELAISSEPVADIASTSTNLLSGRSLMELLRTQPLFSTPGDMGSLVGMQIRHGSRQDFMSAVGLRQGDVITAIDGRQLKDISNISDITAQLASADSVKLSLLRDGEVLDLNIRREQL
jgi:general secretion pathway protein C